MILGNIFFLRFICPALISPEEYNLVTGTHIKEEDFCQFSLFIIHQPDCHLSLDIVLIEFITTDPPQPNIRRGLVALSKVIQNLANGIEFRQSEPYMQPFNSFILENRDRIAEFFDSLSVRFHT
jgi:hypothetical protein